MNEALAITASLAATCWFILAVVLFVKYDKAQEAMRAMRARHRASAPGNTPTRGLDTASEEGAWKAPL